MGITSLTAVNCKADNFRQTLTSQPLHHVSPVHLNSSDAYAKFKRNCFILLSPNHPAKYLALARRKLCQQGHRLSSGRVNFDRSIENAKFTFNFLEHIVLSKWLLKKIFRTQSNGFDRDFDFAMTSYDYARKTRVITDQCLKDLEAVEPRHSQVQ